MPDNIRHDHEGVQHLMDKAKEIETTAQQSAASVDGEAIDPAVAAALSADKKASDTDAEGEKDKSDTVKSSDKDMEATAEADAKSIDKVGSDGADSGAGHHSGDGSSHDTSPSTHTTAADTPAPTIDPEANIHNAPPPPATMPQTAYHGMGYTPTSALNGPIQPSELLGGASVTQPPVSPQQYTAQMQAPGAVDYSHYTPQAGSATQYDANNAPNKQELADEIYEYLRAGQSGDGSDLAEPILDGGSEVRIDPNDPDAEIKVKELAKDFVATKMDYVWGGGHGADPGPTQGVSDGGGAADANGDYNKVGLDCSGLTRAFTYNAYGVDIGAGSAADQYNSGVPISADQARPGDIFFPDSAGRPPRHVQVYIGDGQILEAQQSGTKLLVRDMEPGGEFRRFVK